MLFRVIWDFLVMIINYHRIELAIEIYQDRLTFGWNPVLNSKWIDFWDDQWALAPRLGVGATRKNRCGAWLRLWLRLQLLLSQKLELVCKINYSTRRTSYHKFNYISFFIQQLNARSYLKSGRSKRFAFSQWFLMPIAIGNHQQQLKFHISNWSRSLSPILNANFVSAVAQTKF